MKIPTLEWWTGSNGNLFADHGDTRFCIAYVQCPGCYSIAANGNEIGHAPNIADAKLFVRRYVA